MAQMNVVGLLCPVDGLVLSDANGHFSDNLTERETGSHIHVSFGGFIDCANGHRWKLDDFVMNRTR
jgi:hypothetical protein